MVCWWRRRRLPSPSRRQRQIPRHAARGDRSHLRLTPSSDDCVPFCMPQPSPNLLPRPAPHRQSHGPSTVFFRATTAAPSSLPRPLLLLAHSACMPFLVGVVVRCRPGTCLDTSVVFLRATSIPLLLPNFHVARQPTPPSHPLLRSRSSSSHSRRRRLSPPWPRHLNRWMLSAH